MSRTDFSLSGFDFDVLILQNQLQTGGTACEKTENRHSEHGTCRE